VVGLGKMGLSHQAMFNAHPDVEVPAVCDASAYVVEMLARYTGVRGFTDYDRMLDDLPLDAVVIATPSRHHAPMVRGALLRGLHVFCEKPFVLDPGEGEALARLAQARGCVNQVGYHYRFVGAFREVRRLLAAGAIGPVAHAMAQAYGPVVLRPKGSTWRSRRTEGGGCLYDYAAHPIDLLNWYFGAPVAVGGTVLGSLFSSETEDTVSGTLYFPGSVAAQLSVDWSDESHRKMSTKLTIWGRDGLIEVDRQELRVFLRDGAAPPAGYTHGWNVRHTTDLTDPVWFYVRGEEYSAQVAHFVACALAGRTQTDSSFASAVRTDRVIEMLIADARRGPVPPDVAAVAAPAVPPSRLARWLSLTAR
jgi:predicted dehydrogenase